MMDWYYNASGERTGPVDTDAIKGLVAAGTLTKDSLVWNPSMGGKWAKVAEVPVLAGPSTTPDDPRAKQAFLEKMEERRKIVAQQRRADFGLALVGGVAALLLIVGVTSFVKAKPQRQWGISSSQPLGTVAKLEARLLGEYQMEKEPLTECPLVNLDAAQILRYSKPKGARGAHVGTGGPVTLFLDSKGDVLAILASFASPGQHGYLLVDRSVTSILMNELWHAHGGPTEPRPEGRPTNMGSLTFKPPNGSYVILDNPRMRCIWVESGLNTVDSLVYMEAK